MINLSAIIVAFKSDALLPQCLQALRQVVVAECIVVDNAAQESTRAIAVTQGAHYLPQGSNEDFAAA